MTVPYRITVYCSLIGLALYTGYLLQQSSLPSATTKSNDYHADVFIENVVAVHMDKEGIPQSQLISPKIVHYPAEDTAILTKPHFIIFSNDGENPWHTTAEKGQSKNGKEMIFLWKNVKIHQKPGPNNKDLTMLTSSLTIYPQQEYAETNKPVQFTEPGTVVNAVGMQAFLKDKRVQLLSRTRGEHEKNTG